MRARVVELECASKRLQDALGRAAHVASLETRVVGDADAGQDGDLLGRSPGTRRLPYVASPACCGVIRPRREVRNSLISFFVSTPAQRRPGSQRLGDPASTSLDRDSHRSRSGGPLSAMTTDTRTWIITGAGRRMGVDIAEAALAAGHNVVATGRNPDAVAEAVGDADNLLVAQLDVTSAHDAAAAAQAAVDRFGGIDVLVNNAGSFYAGFFEELSPEQIGRQLATTLVGPMNVTRAVLPVMREQRTRPIRARSGSARSWTTRASSRVPTRCRRRPSRTASAVGRSRARCRAAPATPTTGHGREHRAGRRPRRAHRPLDHVGLRPRGGRRRGRARGAPAQRDGLLRRHRVAPGRIRAGHEGPPSGGPSCARRRAPGSGVSRRGPRDRARVCGRSRRPPRSCAQPGPQVFPWTASG